MSPPLVAEPDVVNPIENVHNDTHGVQQPDMSPLLVAEPDVGHGVRQAIETVAEFKFAY